MNTPPGPVPAAYPRRVKDRFPLFAALGVLFILVVMFLPGGIAAQQYAPDAVDGKRYYTPTRHGAEARCAEVLERIRERLADRP